MYSIKIQLGGRIVPSTEGKTAVDRSGGESEETVKAGQIGRKRVPYRDFFSTPALRWSETERPRFFSRHHKASPLKSFRKLPTVYNERHSNVLSDSGGNARMRRNRPCSKDLQQ